jgi:hypothetical protein
VLIEYSASGRWHFDPRYVALTYAPFYALLLWQAYRDRLQVTAALESLDLVIRH